ncbi:MAG: CRISPR-associated endoribonuclease Cas6 [Candidatus Aerophobetes bacterium]|nr:CRISPR-associated endoribonuclease Cas6 [Candidatus Aerophobetes bacterium]
MRVTILFEHFQENVSLPLSNFSIKPFKINKQSEKIIKYKSTIIKAWMETCNLKGNPELISLAYDAGLDSKNPQGFGMFEILK